MDAILTPSQITMSKQAVSVVRLSLFKDSQVSFLAALDEANIHHQRIHLFSSGVRASGIIETISALSDAMPWNALAKVIVAWLDARKSREVMIQMGDGKTIHAKGYSAEEVEKFLPISTTIAVIDTGSSEDSEARSATQ